MLTLIEVIEWLKFGSVLAAGYWATYMIGSLPC